MTLLAGIPFTLAVVVVVATWFGNEGGMDFWHQYCIEEALSVFYKVAIPIFYLVKRKDLRIYILRVIRTGQM